MTGESPSERSSNWRRVVAAGWVFAVLIMYLVRQLSLHWPKVYEQVSTVFTGK